MSQVCHGWADGKIQAFKFQLCPSLPLSLPWVLKTYPLSWCLLVATFCVFCFNYKIIRSQNFIIIVSRLRQEHHHINWSFKRLALQLLEAIGRY